MWWPVDPDFQSQQYWGCWFMVWTIVDLQQSNIETQNSSELLQVQWTLFQPPSTISLSMYSAPIESIGLCADLCSVLHSGEPAYFIATTLLLARWSWAHYQGQVETYSEGIDEYMDTSTSLLRISEDLDRRCPPQPKKSVVCVKQDVDRPPQQN